MSAIDWIFKCLINDLRWRIQSKAPSIDEPPPERLLAKHASDHWQTLAELASECYLLNQWITWDGIGQLMAIPFWLSYPANDQLWRPITPQQVPPFWHCTACSGTAACRNLVVIWSQALHCQWAPQRVWLWVICLADVSFQGLINQL